MKRLITILLLIAASFPNLVVADDTIYVPFDVSIKAEEVEEVVTALCVENGFSDITPENARASVIAHIKGVVANYRKKELEKKAKEEAENIPMVDIQ